MSLDPMAFAALLLSYVLGSLPTGLWLGLWLRKVDIREAGSKNIGATNTMRVLGKPLGAAALLGDVLKGLIPVILFSRLSLESVHLPLLCGVAAILGHSFSVFLKFRGGKGVATSAGVFLGLVTWPTLIAIGVFAGVVALTRLVSLGSICASVSLAVSVWCFPVSNVIRVVVLLVAVLIVVKHRANLQRIVKGEENRI